MSYLLFLDESGHDHQNTPYEVRGGFAIHARNLWSLVRDLQRIELDCFGTELKTYGGEIKGAKLLEKRRFAWAKQHSILKDDERRQQVLSFFNKGRKREPQTKIEFSAYGQACLQMVDNIFETLEEHKVVIFAASIPRGTEKPDTAKVEEYLRKDQVFLLERYYYFLEREKETGLLVMDETDKEEDHRFVKRLEAYFRLTHTGRFRATKVVPFPFFVSSDMTYPVQAADVCIYCINWGFRRAPGMDGPYREEIRERYSRWLENLQYRGDVDRNGLKYNIFGIVNVPDPYSSR